MNRELEIRFGWIAVGVVLVSALALTTSIGAQVPGDDAPQSIGSAGTGMGNVVREIVDPSSGDRWLLERNDFHPGAPG